MPLLKFLSTLSLRRATSGYFRFPWLDVISIHALLAESDVEKVPADVYYQAFLSTLSLRRATFCPTCQWRRSVISIHALLAESDSWPRGMNPSCLYFYPRSPCGERHTMTTTICIVSKFLSTLSLRRATALVWCFCGGASEFLSTLSLRRATSASYNAYLEEGISIHALLAESDVGTSQVFQRIAISIHALLAESDSKSAQNSGALLRI